MRLKQWASGAVVVAMIGIALTYVGGSPSSSEPFVPYPTPLSESHRLFDIGVVDANGDDRLDLYTSNHHFRQALLLADGHGGYRDVLSEWGLDQSREFPYAELSYIPPTLERPGLYIYWLGSNVIVRARGLAQTPPWSAVLTTYDPVEVRKNVGFEVDKRDGTPPSTPTVMTFSAAAEGQLVLTPGGQGLPLELTLTGGIQPAQVYVGRQSVSPGSTTFSLAMQDRHAMAWTDYNDDGVLDVFVSRGALSGTLRALPDELQRRIRDELFVSRGEGRFEEVAFERGIRKNGCSGRHARWIDYDADGLTDLFVNCYDREHVVGEFPKQLYRREADGQLRDVAHEVGMALADTPIGAFAWLDADGEGRVDLVALRDDGVFLYRNLGARFVPEEVLHRESPETPRIGQASEASSLYDGAFSMADFDADGDVDLILASKGGNALLRSDDGTLRALDLRTLGLPAASLAAAWVDYDNDGAPDLHLVPQGLFRQQRDGTFEATGMLELSPGQHQAAIVTWLDLDNDGARDVLMALKPDPAFKRWWEIKPKPRRSGEWEVLAYRHVGVRGHWLQLRLVGPPGNPQAIGARVTVAAGDRVQTQEVGGHDGAFFSQGHYRLYFGLGERTQADAVRVRWPEGHLQDLASVAGDALVVIRHDGRAPRPLGDP